MFKRSLLVALSCVMLLALLTVVLNSCNSGKEPDKTKTTQNKNSDGPDAEDEEDEVDEADVPEANDSLTDVARFIAGIQPEHTASLKKLAKDTIWKKYASQISVLWKKFETERLNAMDTFAREVLKFETENRNLFYPFSGPDLLHATTFFPKADTAVMIALEPAGNLNFIHEKHIHDSLPGYFASVRQSLHAILNWSFFITKKMHHDLYDQELNGAIHLLLWFAVRKEYEIADIKPATITLDGKLYIASSANDTVYKNRSTKGIYLSLVKDKHAYNVFYYSADLGDWGIKKNKEMTAFLNTYNFSASFVKSASYLLHSAVFTKIRDMILDRSYMHLQDDSGTPFKFFAKRKDWTPYLFGSYASPIRIFNMHQQNDLVKAYDSLEVKKLKFGIGYKHKKEESTLMLFRRK